VHGLTGREVIAYKPHTEDRNELTVSGRMPFWLSKENDHLILTGMYPGKQRFSVQVSVNPARKEPGNQTGRMMAIRRDCVKAPGRRRQVQDAEEQIRN
jgi:hypothetical protein